MLGPEALRIPPHEDHILHTVINESLADVGGPRHRLAQFPYRTKGAQKA